MSTANPQHTNDNIEIPEGSLLEYFYTYHTIDQLNELMNTHPSEIFLEKWGVKVEDYRSTINTAINLVLKD